LFKDIMNPPDDQITIRGGVPEDHQRIIPLMPDWWDGRDLSAMLPKVFFRHFNDTIYIAERAGQLVGFLVGFYSQTDQETGYIHFVGVHPEYRKLGVARMLYGKFFDACRGQGRAIVKSCTSPVNKLSVMFHQAMGFEIESGDSVIDGIPVTTDYLGENDSKVLFKKIL
jgi:predicted GNAT superfamily acetyltransferase